MSHVPPPRPLSLVPTVTPAALQSLCIYNPSLGPTDETLPDQIVFYSSRPTPGTQAVDQNEKLRQIGLAQGLVNFAADFAKNPDGCTCVETEKSRIVILETEEPGWWILARIELTFTHNPTKQPPTSEWSSRDVSPPALLCAQLRRAYSQYRFRYGTFQSNYSQLGRSAFCKRLSKYWRRWAFNRWEVLLNKSPAMDLLVNDSVKMVGKRNGEEMPDQEKRFLKSWIKKEEAKGVIDMVVCRFGEEEEKSAEEETAKGKETETGLTSWLWGKGKDSETAGKKEYRGPPVIGSNDGCVFQGIGELSTRSVIDMTNYMMDMYETSDLNPVSFGQTPTSTHEAPRRRRKRPSLSMSRKPSTGTTSSTEHSPRNSISITRSSESTRPPSSHTSPPVPEIVEESPSLQPLAEIDPTPEEHTQDEDHPQNDTLKPATKPATSKVMSLLTFGWSGSSHKAAPSAPNSAAVSSAPISPEPSAPGTPSLNPTTAIGTPANFQQPRGRFTFGFQGDLNIDDLDDDFENSDGKITSRSVWINRSSAPARSLKECKLVIYTYPPLTFSLLVAPSSPYLTSPSFYRAIHHQLSPLIPRILHPQPLNLPQLVHLPPLSSPPSLSSLSSGKSKASKISKKRESKLLEMQRKQQEYTLLYDPVHKIVHSSIPPIPEPGREMKEWTRADAMGVWGIVLGMMKVKSKDEVSGKGKLKEKSVRSVKGWWILWVRGGEGKEGVLVRRAPVREGEKGEVGGMGVRGDGRKVLEELMSGKGRSEE